LQAYNPYSNLQFQCIGYQIDQDLVNATGIQHDAINVHGFHGWIGLNPKLNTSASSFNLKHALHIIQNTRGADWNLVDLQEIAVEL
jgi:hypothetical protein